MNLKSSFVGKKELGVRVLHDDLDATTTLSQNLVSLLPALYERNIVIVCIGTDRSTGDSLGPLVGTKLKEKGLNSFHVYGTLEEPIHAINLKETVQRIYQMHQNPFIVGIDACLGRMKSVGNVCIGTGPVKPGAGVNKELIPVGDIHITGIVNVSGFMEFFVLQNTRLSLVMKMADLIADSLIEASTTMQQTYSVQPFSPLKRFSKYK
ncbi:spore protease YyaC [Priestia koreensis]|uniref:spore protease YyaC n=1 Tax=Priestia koreensis TaxID=284581 RepID=UPI001F57EF7B|nr:spore protease YyaC [Priestia koreensis]MCM3006560.1 spore protease YyaC [Priestia koreensis]UNL85028.1 spore protease YyaC [Priestia koreensis]